MAKKTYAARGLIDWQLAMNVGGAILRICFTGGGMGSNGVVPAKYTTDNEALQRIIEDNPLFQGGRIFLYYDGTTEKGKGKADDNRNDQNPGANYGSTHR